MSLITRLKHELKVLGVVTLYFGVCFTSIVLLVTLLLSEYHISFYSYPTALISALVVSKVVIVLNSTTIGQRFQYARVIYHVLYQSIIYTIWVFFAVLIEHSISACWEPGGFKITMENLSAELEFNVVLAKTLCVYFSFIGYHVILELNRHLGNGELYRLFFSKRLQAN